MNRFLDSVVHKNRRRRAIHRSLIAAASVAVVVLTIVLGPSVLDRIGGSGGTVPGSNPTPSVVPGVPLLTGTFTRTIHEGTAVVRANGIAGTWTISAGADGRVRLLAPASFTGAQTSHPFGVQAGGLTTDAFVSDICTGLPAGTYTWMLQTGFLVLTPLSDPCDARVVVLSSGPWATST